MSKKDQHKGQHRHQKHQPTTPQAVKPAMPQPAAPPQRPAAAAQQPSTSRPSGPQTLEQRRAKHAWSAVSDVKPDRGAARDFGIHAKKLPMRIRAAGLGQALAFVNAKAQLGNKDEKPGLRKLLGCLSVWVLDERIYGKQGPGSEPGALLGKIRTEDSVFLKRATIETMAYLQWLNRFAEAENLTDGDEDNN